MSHQVPQRRKEHDLQQCQYVSCVTQALTDAAQCSRLGWHGADSYHLLPGLAGVKIDAFFLFQAFTEKLIASLSLYRVMDSRQSCLLPFLEPGPFTEDFALGQAWLTRARGLGPGRRVTVLMFEAIFELVFQFGLSEQYI